MDIEEANHEHGVVSEAGGFEGESGNEARSDELCMWLGEKIPAQYKLERKVQLHQIHYITREIYRFLCSVYNT